MARFQDDFGIGACGSEFALLAYYDRAIKSDSLNRFDYNLARISNTPTVANGIVAQEWNRHVKGTRSKPIDSFESAVMVDGVVEILDGNHYGNRGAAPTESQRIIKMAINSMIEIAIKDHSSRLTDILKMLAYYLVVSGMSKRVSHPALRRFIKELYKAETLTILMMYDYVGSQWRTQRARDIVRKLFKVVGLYNENSN